MVPRLGSVVARARSAAPIILLIILIIALTRPLSASSGLPSHESGIYRSSTMGFYLTAAQLLLEDGWWTWRTCLGFQDLLRFYPPIPILLLAALIRVTGDPGAAAAGAHTVAIGLAAAGLYAYARSLGAGPYRALLAPVLLAAVPGYAGAVSLYWEYPRVLGDGLAFIGLSLLVRGLRWGEPGLVTASGALAGLVLLTSLISVQWMAIAYLATILAYAAWMYRAGSGEAVPAVLGGSWRALLAMVAVSGWWLVPALLPWGVGHYLRIRTGMGEKLGILMDALDLVPDQWVPGIGALFIVAGLAGLLIARGLEQLLPLLAAMLVLAYSLVYGQGPRLYPLVGVLFGISLLAARRAGWVLLAVVAAFYLYYTLPLYADGLSLDYSYQGSDEYKVALWLRGEEGFAYLMYGGSFRGNQWVAAHNPGVAQVLSHYMEGCLNPVATAIDYYMKETLNYGRLYEMLVENNVTVVVVDRGWLESGPTSIGLMLEAGLLEAAEINEYLEYSAAFRVVGSSPGSPEVDAVYWTPSRLLGLALSLLAGARLLGPRLGGGP